MVDKRQNKIKFIYYLYKTFIIILTIVISFFFICSIYFFTYKMKTNNVGYISNYSMLKVYTESMYPAIKPNQNLIIQKKDKYNINDIVAYKKENIIIVHRIIDIEENNIITKGDNNSKKDTPFDKNLIVGKVINFDYKENKLKEPIILKCFNSVFGILILCFIYIGYFFTQTMYSIIKKEETQINDKK